MTRANDVESIDVGLADETIDVSVDEGQTGAGSPVAEKSGLDIVRGDITFDKRIVLEEDHRYRYAFSVEKCKRREEKRRTGRNVVGCAAELLDSTELLG